MTAYVRRQYDDVGDWAEDHGIPVEPVAAPEPDRCPRHNRPLTHTGDCHQCLADMDDRLILDRVRYWQMQSDRADRLDAAWDAHDAHDY